MNILIKDGNLSGTLMSAVKTALLMIPVSVFVFSVLAVQVAEAGGFSSSDSAKKYQVSKLNSGIRLNGHKFMHNSQIGSPLIETYVSNILGAGQTIDLDIPQIRISGDEIVQLEGELAFTKLGLYYQQEIKDWMAFNVGIDILGRLGTQAGSLIAEGVNVVGGYELGWMFKLYSDKKFALSANAELSNQFYTFVDLQGFLEGVIDSGKITKDNKLIDYVPALRAGAGLNMAFAFDPTFGALGYVKIKGGESVDRNEDSEWSFDFGLAADMDLMPKYKVPIGFMLGFYSIDVPRAAGELENDPKNFIFQINYTGKEDLNLALEINYQTYRPLDYDRNIKFVNASFLLKYIFL